MCGDKGRQKGHIWKLKMNYIPDIFYSSAHIDRKNLLNSWIMWTLTRGDIAIETEN